MQKHMYISLFLLFLAGWAQAQNYTGVWNAAMVNDKTKVDTNIEYHLTQIGNTVTGEIIHKKENMKATLTGTLANGEVTGTLKYDKNQWASLDQKFRIFIRPNDNATMFMHESTKGARYFGGPLFKNQTLTNQQASKAQAATSLQKGAFSAGSGTVVQQSTAKPKVGVAMATTPKKTARNIGGYYRIEGMTDASGTKRNLFVNVRNFPDSKDRSKAYGEALILGEAYGIGSSGGRLFGYETNGDDVTVMFDTIYELNKKNTMANGRIEGIYLIAPKLGYKMIKISQAEAEKNSKATDYEYKVTVVGVLIKSEFRESLPKLYGNIRVNGILETRTDRKKVENNQKQSDLIWNVSKAGSRPAQRNIKSYQDKKKNLFFANGMKGVKFYKFSADVNPVEDTYFIPLELSRTFSVRPEWLSGENQRFMFEVYAELFDDSGAVLTYNFGKKTRGVYLHELDDFNKLWSSEKSANRVINSRSDTEGIAISAPFYFQVNGSDERGIGIFGTEKWSTLVFKIERIER
ncbi:hypothetical protein SAMN04489724_0252 [Algoriphagus locisalis]|uniref:DUF5689 domain-containing protein n=1 Tax=Algoriphagus locisalis TaxID=305507 RepID=A0A1I7E884_9BACT|nr:hypothetical protein [Algoriphagus locisalis]SFU20147.1 hypothetical protein SAMN04489724_0252 [Algoriphagus locisalis]